MSPVTTAVSLVATLLKSLNFSDDEPELTTSTDPITDELQMEAHIQSMFQ
jgi:hypothetical protein